VTGEAPAEEIFRATWRPAVAERLRELQATRLRFKDPVEAQWNAVLVDAFLTGAYLALDGCILEHDFLANTVRLVHAGPDAWSTLVVAAERLSLPELLEHLPPVPSDHVVCTQCSGSRWACLGREIRSNKPVRVICPQCKGLGWCIPEEPPGNSCRPVA
jgi:hypothetical protein